MQCDAVPEKKNMVDMMPDGNCFYRSVSYAVTGNQNNHRELRYQTHLYALQNRDVLLNYCRLDDNIDEVILKMRCDKVFATEFDIQCVASMLNCYIFTFSKSGASWKWLRYQPCKELKPIALLSLSDEGLYLYNKNLNHYDVVSEVWFRWCIVHTLIATVK